MKIQERIVFEANVKNQIYKKGLDYLDDEYARVLAIADKTKEATSNMQTGVTEEMRKAWRSEDTKLRRETSFSEFTEDVGIKLRKELQDRADKAPIPVSYLILPTFEESEETPDITGSVADFEKQLQDVTLAYNEATKRRPEILVRQAYRGSPRNVGEDEGRERGDDGYSRPDQRHDTGERRLRFRGAWGGHRYG